MTKLTNMPERVVVGTGADRKVVKHGEFLGNCDFCGCAQYENVEYHETMCWKMRALVARIAELERKVESLWRRS